MKKHLYDYILDLSSRNGSGQAKKQKLLKDIWHKSEVKERERTKEGKQNSTHNSSCANSKQGRL